MITYVILRALLMLKRQTWVLWVLALLALVALVVPAYGRFKHGEPIIPLPIAAAAPARDCAGIFMASTTGPDEQAARAAFQCTAGQAQRMLESEAKAVAANAQFEIEPAPIRIGQSQTFSDGTYYVIFAGSDATGQHHSWYVLTLDRDGKIINLE